MSDEKDNSYKHSGTTWGPKLFILTFIAVLIFFYWLLIYSGGINVSHS